MLLGNKYFFILFIEHPFIDVTIHKELKLGLLHSYYGILSY